jgi:hypothetical protein
MDRVEEFIGRPNLSELLQSFVVALYAGKCFTQIGRRCKLPFKLTSITGRKPARDIIMQFLVVAHIIFAAHRLPP